jgi:type II secretory pathway pseudopilin PulG
MNWLRADRPQRSRHGGTHAGPARSGRPLNRGDSGFTLVELLIVITVVPLIIGSISLALLATFQLQSSVSDRLGASGDAQMVAASFYRDVQSATQFTTNGTPSVSGQPPQCGPDPQLLGLQWSPSAAPTTVVSYVVTSNGVVTPLGVNEYNLTRLQCNWVKGSSPTLVNKSVLSFNTPGTLKPAIQGQSCTTTCAPGTPWESSWVSATGIQEMSLLINEAATNSASYDTACDPGIAFCYTVLAAPRAWEQIVGGSPPPLATGLVAAEFIGSTGVNLASCDSKNPNLDINGQMVIDSGTSPTITGTKTNIYPDSVSYYGPGGVPTNIAAGVTPSPISQPMLDPLLNMPAPDMTGQPTNPPTQTIGSITYAYPGIYTTPLSGTLTLTSGVYELEAGLNGNLTSGVGGNLLYVTGGQVLPTGMQVWPMTTGNYAGLTLWQGPAVVDGIKNYDTTALDSGPGPAQLGGVVYAPGAIFYWHGDASLWVGTLLTKGLTCLGGGSDNGQLNIGFSQSVTFTSTAPSNASVGGQYSVSAVSANTPNSGNPVTYSIDNLSTSKVCSISGSTVHFTGAGTCLVDARQAQSNQGSGGTGGYLEAPTIQQAIPVGP